MRIAIVNDMPLAVEAMRRVLATEKRHSLSWTARDGAEAVEKCAADTPDLILMDLIMPVMDGVEATRRIMSETPCAILVVTATVEGNATRVYEALGAGALDAVETPAFGKGSGFLLVKLDLLERQIMGRQSTSPLFSAAAMEKKVETPADGAQAADWLVAIGASAGGPAALAKVLAGLPADFPGAIVIVQHIDTAFAAGLISWLDSQCALKVVAAGDGVYPLPGHVYVASGDRHAVISPSGLLVQTDEPRGCIYLPSIDVFLTSMASNWKKAGTGLLLTGMGRDGAAGLLRLRQAGFFTITQDRESSAVYGMPKAAAELNAASQVLSLQSISGQLRQLALDKTKLKRR
ncbi:chemotaxis response regulator protein-glutamate methylesterase [Rariglobus hedericola]|uniref:Protein-glutamate methylesterase/protein-glutamine glutaminase n=1 Tax=Rariglobus hedericola TaxID=2597822 RepID=A0A556QJL5_9BACT|nr:chemotaxis response regulator protein-glutamate methylesterase [Rariglobus hedericola]TSJ76845.1 chemotaxis response regulator protein-glutamate methylesterase [Rariglobus hedericola]